MRCEDVQGYSTAKQTESWPGYSLRDTKVLDTQRSILQQSEKQICRVKKVV
jgi:hypothetical protein